MTNIDERSIFERAYNPIAQAVVVYVIAVTIILLSKVIKLTQIIDVSERFPWMTAGAFMLLFSLFNSVYSLTTKNLMQYWQRSIYSFLGLAVVLGLTAYAFSFIPIGDAGSYRWIYIVVTIGYLVFLSMVTFMRKIVEFAQREEWNQPRKRRR